MTVAHQRIKPVVAGEGGVCMYVGLGSSCMDLTPTFRPRVGLQEGGAGSESSTALHLSPDAPVDDSAQTLLPLPLPVSLPPLLCLALLHLAESPKKL